MTFPSKTVTGSLMGDPRPGRTPWAPPVPPEPIARPVRPVLAQNSAGSPREHGVLQGGEPSPAPPPAGTADEGRDFSQGLTDEEYDADVAAHVQVMEALEARESSGGNSTSEACETQEIRTDFGANRSAETLRPVAPICAAGIEPGTPPTSEPLMEWMAPSDLLVDGAYQRDLSDKSVKLIRRIVEHWDWRRFKPPVVAWTDAGFEIIDGQHTAIAAATHPTINRIPVLIVEAAELKDRASAFIGHNKDRLAVSAVQMHNAAATAGDEGAATVNQVCQRAGVKLITGAWGGYAWQPGETVAIGAIRKLIDQRGAMKARLLLQALRAAGRAPISVHDIKAADLLFHSPDFAGDLEPLPVGGEDLAQAIRNLGANGAKEAREYADLKCLPLWKAQAAVWFKKTRKRRRAP